MASKTRLCATTARFVGSVSALLQPMGLKERQPESTGTLEQPPSVTAVAIIKPVSRKDFDRAASSLGFFDIGLCPLFDLRDGLCRPFVFVVKREREPCAENESDKPSCCCDASPQS